MAEEDESRVRAEIARSRRSAGLSQATVGRVAAHVSATKGHARTTVLNVMARLSRKGYLSRRQVGGVYHYSPRVPKADLLRRLVGEFVDKALGGSLSPFVAYLGHDAKLSEDDLRELKRLVAELEAGQRGTKS